MEGFSQLARAKKLRKRHKACGVANKYGGQYDLASSLTTTIQHLDSYAPVPVGLGFSPFSLVISELMIAFLPSLLDCGSNEFIR
jgi:hypothetical protein